MANREDLAIIKAARTGMATAQLALGSRYFSGGSGLPQSDGTAFYWLEKSARQGLPEAWLMIGRHVSYEMVNAMPRPYEAAAWYEKSFDDGIGKAGLIFARLVVNYPQHFDPATKRKAFETLRALAEQDDPDAQWLLAQQIQLAETSGAIGAQALMEVALISQCDEQWTQRAAQAGVEDAQYSLLEKAWLRSDFALFLQRAAPIVDKIWRKHSGVSIQVIDGVPVAEVLPLEIRERGLLLRFSLLSLNAEAPDLARVQQLLELASMAGDQEAGFELGLLHARIDRQGERRFPGQGLANYNKAVPWLLLSARSGYAPSWHALSRIYAKSEFSQRNLRIAKKYLERAAEMGLAEAQFEYAKTSWRNRRDDPFNDIRALHWWMKAAEQGCTEARDALAPFSVRVSPSMWAMEACLRLSKKIKISHPFLAARLELAAIFGLTRPEALLLDIAGADHGHCLEVDISQRHARSRRRLVLIEDHEQRTTLNRISRLFSDVDCSDLGPEGNYRQRQYLLKTLLSECV